MDNWTNDEAGNEIGPDDLWVMWRSAPTLRADARQGGTGGDAAVATLAPPATAAPSPPPEPACEVPLEVVERRICALAGRIAASMREWLTLIAEFDARKGWAQWGIKSCAHWLAWSCAVAPGAAREYVRVATTLAAVPALDAAFAQGRLSYSKMRALTRVAGQVDEQTLLRQGLTHTASQLERVVRGYRKASGTRAQQETRRQARWGWDDDGMLVLSARLPAEEGALLIAALDRARSTLNPPPDAAPDGQECTPQNRPDPDEQTTAADALVAVSQAALAAGDVDSSGDDEHLVVLLADVEVLTGVDTDTNPQPDAGVTECRLEHGPGVEAATARRLACDAAILPVLRTADPGEPLRIGRKTRKIPPALRRMLRLRDEDCQFPGCHRQRHLQAHHVQHWAHGGATDPDNLVLLCRRHHMAVHEIGYTVAADHTGAWQFHRPDGTPVPTNPELDGEPLLAGDMPPHHIGADGTGEGFDLADSVAAFFGT